MREITVGPAITNVETAALAHYLNDIARVPLLTTDQEVILAKKAQQGDKAALDKLISANLKFVVSVAKKYQHMGLTLSDLIAEGNLGLIKAAEKFDVTKGFKFISFAVWWIRQSILQAIAEHSRIIRLPVTQIRAVTALNKAAIHAEQLCGYTPSSNQLAYLAGISYEKAKDIELHSQRTISYDAQVNGASESLTVLDTLPNRMPSVLDQLNREEFEACLHNLISNLPPLERRVIALTFGFEGGREHAPGEIAVKINYTKSRISQIRKGAISSLRKHLDHLLSEFQN